MAVIIMLAYAAGFISVSFASGIQCARSIIPYVDGITARLGTIKLVHYVNSVGTGMLNTCIEFAR